MGVPGLFGQYVRNEYSSAVTDTLPSSGEEFIETLEIDMGGLMHACAKTVYAYDDGYSKARAGEVQETLRTEDGRKSLEDSFCLTVSGRIVELTKAFIAEVNPHYKRVANLVIAMDGVAPFAKIMQQRTRRYRRTVHTTEEEEEEMISGGRRKMPPPEGWQTNSITPGTDFIDKFDTYMRGWVTKPEAQNLVQYKIIFSSYKKRGEGEHKLFGFRRGKKYAHHSAKEKGLLCVYGLDADLILLNLLYPKRRVYIIRERESLTPEDVGTKYHANIVNIDILRDEIVMRMTGINDLNELDRDSYYSVIRDFVLMTFFLGNDFLPRIMCYRDIIPTLKSFTAVYKNFIFNLPSEGKKISKKKVEGFYTSDNGFLSREDGSIDWPIFSLFLKQITAFEPDNLLQIGIKMKRTVQSQKHISLPSKAINKALTIELKEETSADQTKRSYKLNMHKFRNWWYNLAIGPRTEAMKRFAKDNGVKYLDDVDDMCSLYLEGLQWVLLYYVGGTEEVGKLWSYTYTQSPLMQDIDEMCDFLIKERKTPRVSKLKTKFSDPVFGPIHQLLSVMPPKSAPLINSLFSHLILKVHPLCYIAPIEFKVDYESARKEHEGVAILPLVDPYNIVKIVTETIGKHKIEGEYIGTKELEDAIISVSHASYITFSKKESAQKEEEALAMLEQARGKSRSKSVGPSASRKGSSYKKPYSKPEGSSYRKSSQEEGKPYSRPEGSSYKKPYSRPEGSSYKKPYSKPEGSSYKKPSQEEGKPYVPGGSTYRKPYSKPGEQPLYKRPSQLGERKEETGQRSRSEERPTPRPGGVPFKPKPLNLSFNPVRKQG